MVAGMTMAAMLLPVIASADTIDVQSQIQALLSQIQTLQQQLRTLVASSTSAMGGEHGWMMGSTTPVAMPSGQIAKAACVTLNRNLGVGSRGDDVKGLQQMLSDDSESGYSGGVTGYFGPATARAMAKYQTRFGIASSSTGFVGALTRGFFEKRCGEGLGTQAGDQHDLMNAAIGGTITVAGASSITVQDSAGTSVVVNLTASTSIQVFNGTSTPPTVGSAADLTVGRSVRAQGTKNSDGSVTAVHIAVGTLPTPSMMDGEHGMGMMPINGGQNTGRGLDGHGPQNW